MRTSPRGHLASAILLVLLLTVHSIVAKHGDGDVVRAWNELALHTVRTLRLSDAQAARLYAMVNVAMYDAVNGIVSRHGGDGRGHALVPGERAPANGDLEIAAAAAAHAVLTGEHCQFSNVEALAKGRAVAAEIAATKLLRRRGPSHFGQCPL